METNSVAGGGSTTSNAADLKERVTEGVSGAVDSVRARTGNMQAGLADLLESSAQAIRSRGVSAADSAGSAVGDGAAERLAQTGEATADILERGAMWLRDNDLSDLEERITGQLERHPARTLLVAAGIGFLLSRRR
jgi:hypothetical protein